MSTGMIGMTDYLGYFWHMSSWVSHLVAVGFTVLTVALLWRRIESVAAITKLLWAGMLVTAIACFFTLTTIINALIALVIWVQFIGQIAALTILRKKQPRLRRLYKQWLYPVPSIIALAGWIYIFQASGWSAIRIMLIWTALGVVAFLIWARIEHTWPFGPKIIYEEFPEDIYEEFLEEQKASALPAEHRKAARTATSPNPGRCEATARNRDPAF